MKRAVERNAQIAAEARLGIPLVRIAEHFHLSTTRVKQIAVCEGAASPRTTDHGTTTRYIYGCRCSQCKLAQAVSNAEGQARRVRLPVPDHVHGYNGYHNYSCRCSICNDANNAYSRSKRKKDAG